jgi:membrane associated rhomboid family serine protease
MLLPYSLVDATVRRWPVVTFVLIGLNVLVFLGQLAFARSARDEVADDYRSALAYQAAHPYLKPPPLLAGGVTERGVSRSLPRANVPDGLSDADVEEEQRELDRLCARVEAHRKDDPSQRWGFVPRDGASIGLFTHMFFHGGLLHLVGNMWFLWLAAACIEDRWGRGVFALFYLLAGVIAALAHFASQPGSRAPLVGASGAIAGLMGAFLVLFATKRIRFFYVWGFRFGTFEAPAYLMLPLWLVVQIFFAALPQLDGVAYWAHLGGFAFGAALAGLLRVTGADERLDAWVEEGT